MLISLAVLLLASAVILRLLWQTEHLHKERLGNAHQQYLTAKILLEDGSEESAAQLWKLHWIASQERFSSYTDKKHWPRLSMLYFEQPYQLHNRLELIGGRTENNIAISELHIANSMLLHGLQSVIDELSDNSHAYSRPLKIAALMILPALLLWSLAYHWLVYLPMHRHSILAENELNYAAGELDTLTYSDPLTQTSNRKSITQFLSDFEEHYTHDDSYIALAILDLDYFQQINDVFGYFAGDAVLKEVATRIDTELRDGDQFGRIDSDRFAIVLCDLVAPKNAEQIIDRIQLAIERPLHYKQNTLNVTCTVGATVQLASEIEISDLFKLSDQALLQAKRNRRGSVFLLSDTEQQALSRQRQIINTIKNSSPDDIFDLVYQPIVDLKTRKIASCECLLRWTANEPTDLEASELVPILEMFGDINEVGLWVLKTSMQQLKTWQTELNASELIMSVNLSARQLESEDFAQQITAIARDLDLPPQSVSLELTETVAIKHLEAGRQQLALLKNHGFNVSLDDFGTGYSSLQYLKQIPATSVKIDQSFISELLKDDRDMAIVKAAVDIATAVGLKVIAEGIDTDEQADCLQLLGCQYGQGYLFAKPLSGPEFARQLVCRTPTENGGFQNHTAA